MHIDLYNSLAPSSRKQYKSYWNVFKTFISHYFKIEPVYATSYEIQHFVTYLSQYKHLGVSSIRCYLSSIGFHIKLKTNSDPTKSFALSRLLKTYSKISKPVNIRKPIDYMLLRKLCQSVQLSKLSYYYKLCYVNMYNLMYHAALRVSEIAHSSTDEHILSLNSIKFNYNSSLISINFKSYKHSKEECPVIVIKCERSVKRAFQKYLDLRGRHTGPIFCHVDHSPFKRDEIVKQLKSHLDSINYNSSHYNTHSFRIGKATDMSIAGYSELEIKQLGRWKSDAYKRYLKPHTIYSKLGHTSLRN